MRLLCAAVACGLVSGCALNMRLLEDGKVHQGEFSPGTRSMSATIDGDFYEGPISQGSAVGFGTAFSGGKVGFGTMTASSSQFTGILTNRTGKVIQCQFNAALGAGSGMCEGMDGRRYALVIGRMPSDPKPDTWCAPGKVDNGGGCVR